MAAAYRTHGEPYRESIRSVQSNSVYSTDSGSSPLDSIIRDYPLVPGASPSAFQFSPNSYNSSPRMPASLANKYQQQPSTQARLREPQYPPAHAHSGSSPLLHTRFRSPTDSMSLNPQRPDSTQTDLQSENFMDLRESRAYEYIEAPKAPQSTQNSNPYAHSAHGAPPRSGHGVTPLLQLAKGGSLRPIYGEQPVSRSNTVSSDTQVETEVPNPTTTAGSYDLPDSHTNSLTVHRDDSDSYDRGSWRTQYSEQDPARQTWMTTTSGITNGGDPFSFRHFESPQASAVPPREIAPNSSIPKLLVHSPGIIDISPYTNDNIYSSNQDPDHQNDEANDVVGPYAYVPPSPIDVSPQGRVPSKVPVTTRYNFSRPIRSELRVSNEPVTTTPARGSQYSAMSMSTDIPHTISNFPDPLMPGSSTMPVSQQQQNVGQSNPPSRQATKRMSVPKTIPNLVYTDDQLSPSPTRKDLALINSPLLNALPLSGSPGRSDMNQASLAPRNLSPIGDRSRSPSPSGLAPESARYHTPSPIPGPPRSYDVPYTYRVTITDRQYLTNGYQNSSSSSQSGHSADSHHTRYSLGGSAVPPAPREVIALPSSPPQVIPRPGSNLSLYSRYSFYSAGDLPGSAAPTPRGWEKSGVDTTRVEGDASSSRSGQTPTPTGGKMKGKGKGARDSSDLPYLNIPPNDTPLLEPFSAATDNSGISPQECLLLGISHHEANRLEESAYWFEKAANENGGCGVGMFMWGLSLRHAWGVEKDERAAFWWLRRAAECAVHDMERTTQEGPEKEAASDAEKERDRKAVQSELVLAVYEVGQCFFHGWGVEADKRMAVSYFQVAARLGDVDAQLELGFCYAKGKGCKKDLRESAKWYRAAAARGASTIGLAWIYKPKYGGPGGDEQFTDTPTHPVLPSSKSSIAPSAKSSTGKSETRRLKKPPPRSRTPSAITKSPAPADMAKNLSIELGS